MPFGYQRAEVLGALASILLIWFLTLVLVWSAVQRIVELSSTSIPVDVVRHVDGKMMFSVACVGLIVNISLMKILGHGHSHGSGHSHSHGHSDVHHGHSHGQNTKHHIHSHGHSHGEKCRHSCSHSGVSCDDTNPDHEHKHKDSHQHGEYQYEHGSLKRLESPASTVETVTIEFEEDESEAVPTNNQMNAESCSHENLNVRAAYLHALGDFLQSLGVCLAGAIIWFVLNGQHHRNTFIINLVSLITHRHCIRLKPSWQLCDPIMTLCFSIIVACTTMGIFKTTVLVLMEGTPAEWGMST
jgi:zinc transporter 2